MLKRSGSLSLIWLFALLILCYCCSFCVKSKEQQQAELAPSCWSTTHNSYHDSNDYTNNDPITNELYGDYGATGASFMALLEENMFGTNNTNKTSPAVIDTTKPRRITAYGIVLIVCACLLPIAAVTISTLFVCYYGSKEDSWLAWTPRLVVCIGLGLTFLTIVLLPLDVANAKMKGGLDFGLGIFWQVLFGVLLVFVVVVIPFATFYYESEDPDKGIRHQIIWGLVYSIAALVIFLAVFGVTYYWFGQSYVPYNLHIQGEYAFDEFEASFEGVSSFLMHSTRTPSSSSGPLRS